MALTNFGLLTAEQKTVWSMDLWKQARNQSFINKFLGKGPNSMVQHITELKKSEKGARAVITLLADLTGDGVAGDRTLEGNEEAMQSFDQVIRIDQLRHANRHEGRMADQKSVVEFRGNSRDVLAYWLADRIDQLAFLTLSGVSYAKTNATIVGGAIGTGDYPTWGAFVQMKAYAKDHYIRGVRSKGGDEVFHVFLSPLAMAKLKLDNDFMLNLRHAMPRGENNPLFSSAAVRIDDIVFHEFRHVPNTRTAAGGSKWGGGGVDGCRVLFCGAQALGMADIGNPEWVEKGFDYENQQGIATGKILGFLKPKFYTQYSGSTVEDFGVIAVDVAQ